MRRLRLKDAYGVTGFGIVVATVAIIAALVAIIVPAVKVGEEASCNQQAAQLQHVKGGDYRFWSGTCYLTLTDGQVIPSDKYRFITITGHNAGRK